MINGNPTTDFRLPKDYAVRLVIQFANEYVEMLTAFRGVGGGLQLPRRLLDLRDHLKINNYSELYDDERKINVSGMESSRSGAPDGLA